MDKIQKHLKKFLKKDSDFKQLFNSIYNKKVLKKEYHSNFNNLLNLFLSEIFETCENEIFLDCYFKDISWIEIDNKIINLDFLYNEFKNWDY